VCCADVEAALGSKGRKGGRTGAPTPKMADIAPEWLEEGGETAACPVCFMVMKEPTIGCPEGHALCRACYLQVLGYTRYCTICQHPTDASKLQKCRLAEELIGRLWLRCKHGQEEGQTWEDSPVKLVKRAKKEPLAWSSPDLRKELGRRGLYAEGERDELAVRLVEHFEEFGVAGRSQDVHRATWCTWRSTLNPQPLKLKP